MWDIIGIVSITITILLFAIDHYRKDYFIGKVFYDVKNDQIKIKIERNRNKNVTRKIEIFAKYKQLNNDEIDEWCAYIDFNKLYRKTINLSEILREKYRVYEDLLCACSSFHGTPIDISKFTKYLIGFYYKDSGDPDTLLNLRISSKTLQIINNKFNELKNKCGFQNY